MRRAAWAIGTAAAALTVAAAGQATAQSRLIIRDAVARVVVIPEDRTDVVVEIRQPASVLPRMTQSRRGDVLELDGGVERGVSCRGGRDGPAEITGRFGRVSLDQAPQVIARVPRRADVSAGPAVWGEVGRSQSLELNIAGCGVWTVANTGDLEIASAGSGAVRAGSASAARVRSAGSGSISLRDVSGPLTAEVAGSGDVRAVSAAGSVRVRVAGSGDVTVESGRTSELTASVAGSGDVVFGGRAERVDASLVGSGDVRVREAGSVSRRSVGSGRVIVGAAE